MVAFILTLVGTVAGVGAAWFAWLALRPQRVIASQRGFISTRNALNRQRAQLTDLARTRYPTIPTIGRSSLLRCDRWLPEVPVPLDHIELINNRNPPLPAVTGISKPATKHLPLANHRVRYARYSTAVRELCPPALFVDRVCYRVVDVAFAEDRARVTLSRTTFFETLDLAEALAHELAMTSHEIATDSSGRRFRARRGTTPLRKRLGDPFDLTRRSFYASIDTLTLRRDGADLTFLLHLRDPRQVAIAGGLFQVAPSAVFQPASISPASCERDRNFWLNTVREYAEEFLGADEAIGDAGAAVNYDRDAPYAGINQAIVDGEAGFWLLGAGIDPLTLCVEFLTVAVFSATAFDRIFGGMSDTNAEGTIVSAGTSAEGLVGFRFVREEVDRLLEGQPMSPAATACIELAFQHRELFKIGAIR